MITAFVVQLYSLQDCYPPPPPPLSTVLPPPLKETTHALSSIVVFHSQLPKVDSGSSLPIHRRIKSVVLIPCLLMRGREAPPNLTFNPFFVLSASIVHAGTNCYHVKACPERPISCMCLSKSLCVVAGHVCVWGGGGGEGTLSISLTDSSNTMLG